MKTETRTGYTCEGDVCRPGELKMTDTKTSSSTKLTRKSWKVDEAMSDELFSKRNLDK